MAESLRGAGPEPSANEADRVWAGLQRALHAAAQPAPEAVHLAKCGHCGSLNGLSAAHCWQCGNDLQSSRPGEPEQVFAAIVEGAAQGAGSGEAAAARPVWGAPSSAAAASPSASASASTSRVRRPPSTPSPPRRGRAPSGGVMLLGVVVVAASLQGASYYFGHDSEVDPAAARSTGGFAARPAPAPPPASAAADAIASQIAAALERADRAIAGTVAERPAPPDAAALAALERPAPATASSGTTPALAPTATARAAPPMLAQRNPGKPADAWPVAAAVIAAAAARARSGAPPPAPPRPASCSAAMAALSLCSPESAAKGEAR